MFNVFLLVNYPEREREREKELERVRDLERERDICLKERERVCYKKVTQG